MHTTIYYFSGTGNSLAVARDLSERIDGTLIPVASIIEQERIETDAEVIGMVFPIYDFKPAKIIERLIDKLYYPDAAYLFAVCTYGITPGKTMKYVDAMFKSRGGKLSAGFAVAMPHNGLGAQLFSPEQHDQLFMAWNQRRDLVAKDIQARKQGICETSNLLISTVCSGFLLKAIPILWPLVTQGITQGWGSLKYFADGQCNGCEICQRLCPVKNIVMADKRPSWLGECEGCFACVHWCPQAAIQIGNLTRNMPRYHHPDVQLSDLMRRQ